MTRHFYAGGRRLAQSQVLLGTGSPLLARAGGGEPLTLLASLRDVVRGGRGPLYPHYALAAEDAAKLAALLLIILIVLDLTPGRVRLGIHTRVRRGHVLVLVVVFGLSLTPLTCVRLAHGGGGGPPGPPATFPAYFVHTDHLGSTVLLTCYLQHSDCADGAPAQYIRYDAYGIPKAFDTTGAAVTSPITDLLYTGQRWDAGARLYYYGARYYDPRIARFVSQDPVREYMNPYAYVRWNPVRFTDPTGMFLVGSFNLYLSALGPEAAARYAAWSGGNAMSGSISGAVGDVGGSNGAGTRAGSIQGMISAAIQARFAQTIQSVAGAQGGGVMTAAYPVFNASLANQVASTGDFSASGWAPQSFGVAFSSNATAGVGHVASAAIDVNALMGFFPGDLQFGSGNYTYGEAVGGGAYATALGRSVGVPANQGDSATYGASVTVFSGGFFASNATSAYQLAGLFQTLQVNIGPVNVQVDTGGGVYVGSITFSPGILSPFFGLSVASFSTLAPEGAVSGR